MRLSFTLVLFLFTTQYAAAAEPAYERRWVYCSHNLLVEKNVDDLIAIIQRAEKAGYTGIMLADFKFNILGRMPEKYFKNVERVKKAAADAKLEIIPSLFPIGYSDGLLYHDPNLAEGVPVKNAPFLVKGKQAKLASKPPAFQNGELEKSSKDRFTGFRFQDDPGVATFVDSEVRHGGKSSCRMQDAKGNCRLMQTIKVRPWACYRFSCWLKTKDLKPCEFKLLALPTSKGGRGLTFHEIHPKETEDWTQIEVVFNSLNESEVNLYLGVWGGLQGKLWIDDIKVEELELVNVLRRDACPLVVTSEDGTTVYEEGKDFQPVRDEQIFKAQGGGYDFKHAGPVIKLPEGSRIKDGDTLLVSWYHPIVVYGFQVAASLSDPKVFDLLRDQAKRVNNLFQPKTFFMAHDEIRVAGWCKQAEKSGRTPGQLLADNVSQCVKILKETNPKARIAVWSDMFDPNHNAVDQYYLVNGSLKGSWEGLPKDVIIANWNGGKGAASLKWFADRGHEQIIAGYYDGDLRNFQQWDEARKGIPHVTGFMYTTWQHRYNHLEEYGQALKK